MSYCLELEERLVATHERSCAELCDLFELIVEFERTDAYKVDGARSMADWVSYRFGYGDQTSRDYCRIAAALQSLPAIADAFRAGLLVLEKVKWLTEFCTPEEDAAWANGAIGMSAAEVRTAAMQRRRLATEAADRRFRRRYLRMRVNEEAGEFRFWGRLSDTEGAVVKKAIERIADAAPSDPETRRVEPYERRCADALVELASLRLGADADPDRATVVAHVDAAVISSSDGVGMLDGDVPVCAETIRRLTCDGRLQALVYHENGRITGGRASRTVPPSLRRLVMARDGQCRFEGCSSKRWLHAHHVRHWARGGPTTEDNLVMLCGYHHRLVHEGGRAIRGLSGSDLHVVRPGGIAQQRTGHALAEVAARGP